MLKPIDHYATIKLCYKTILIYIILCYIRLYTKEKQGMNKFVDIIKNQWSDSPYWEIDSMKMSSIVFLFMMTFVVLNTHLRTLLVRLHRMFPKKQSFFGAFHAPAMRRSGSVSLPWRRLSIIVNKNASNEANGVKIVNVLNKITFDISLIRVLCFNHAKKEKNHAA